MFSQIPAYEGFKVLDNELHGPENVCDMTVEEFELATKRYHDTVFDWVVPDDAQRSYLM